MRRQHILKGNRDLRLPLRMVWVDTEALNEYGKVGAGVQKLYFGVAIYHAYRSSNNPQPFDSDRLRFDSVARFWDWCLGKSLPGRSLWVLAHNWNYDAGILDTSHQLLARGWEMEKYVNGKPPLIVRWGKNGAHLTMIDTLNYFTTSVESLGKAVGLRKLDMPQGGGSVSDWDEYAWRDVEIIQKAFLALRDFVKVNDLGVMQPTLASQSLTAYRHRFMDVSILIHDKEKALDLERESYHGGRTESFWNSEIRQKLYKLDINAMYPSIMRETPLARWIKAYYPQYDPGAWEKAVSGDFSIVARCRIETNEPAYGVVRDSKLIFPVGSFSTVLSTPEIHYALEHQHLKEIGEFTYYERAVLFRDFVDYFYAQRQNYKQQGNASFEFMCKILMNSLYGKFGQNGRKWVETDEYQWFEDREGVLLNEIGQIVKLRRRLGRTQMLELEGESENSFPLIASEITAYARMKLWQLIKQAGLEHVYYVDTDSLIVDETGYGNLADQCHPTQLGSLKLEATADISVFHAPKHYVFGKDWKIKGIRKSAQRINENQYQQEQFRSWDYNLSKNKDGFIEVLPIIKNISGVNNKRLVEGVGWTQPLVLVE